MLEVGDVSQFVFSQFSNISSKASLDLNAPVNVKEVPIKNGTSIKNASHVYTSTQERQEYMEAQYHGQLSAADISSIMLPKSKNVWSYEIGDWAIKDIDYSGEYNQTLFKSVKEKGIKVAFESLKL